MEVDRQADPGGRAENYYAGQKFELDPHLEAKRQYILHCLQQVERGGAEALAQVNPAIR